MLQASVLKGTSVATALTISGVLALCLLLPIAPAHAQPQIGDALDQVTDTVDKAAGTVGKTVTETGAKAGDAVTDTGATVGDAVGGSAGGAVKDTSGTVGSTIKDTSASAGSTLDGATKELSEETKGVTRLIGETLGEAGLTDDSGNKGADGGNNPTTTTGARDSNGAPMGFHRVPDRLAEASVAPLLLTPNQNGSASTTPLGATSSDSPLADAVRRALEAVERFAFPLALTLLVFAYLSVQGWFDRRDPKLALAAVDPEADLLRFE